MSAQSNPWVSAAADRMGASEPEAAMPPASGPTAPQPGVPAPDTGLPRRSHLARAAPWWLGVHGGAGESTLAALLPGSLPAEHRWPATHATGAGEPVVLVARTSMYGLQRVQLAATEWASGSVPGIQLLGLVLVADAPGRLPAPLRDLATVISGGLPRVWRLPWMEALRLSADPTAVEAPRPLRRLLDDVRSLLPAAPAATAALTEREAPRAHHHAARR